MCYKRIHLVAGLGNPGGKYEKTRHNAGFMVVDEVADAYSIALVKKRFDACFGRGFIDDSEVILAKPMTFMNRSGSPLRKLANYFHIPFEDILIIHDDIDLAYGRLKIKAGGGHGGHNGIRSIIEAFGSGSFARLRVGIGRPEPKIDVINHVLGRFTADENQILDLMLNKAGDAVVTILCKGIKEAMNKFH